jgi:hypothetical protein
LIDGNMLLNRVTKFFCASLWTTGYLWTITSL